MTLFDKWAFAKPLLERAIDQCHGTHTIDDICLMVGSGHFTLITGERSALLIERCDFPRFKGLNCFMGAGDYDELINIRETVVEPYMKQNGITRIQGGGRDGWKKTLPGFSYGGTFMYKDVE